MSAVSIPGVWDLPASQTSLLPDRESISSKTGTALGPNSVAPAFSQRRPGSAADPGFIIPVFGLANYSLFESDPVQDGFIVACMGRLAPS